MAKAMTKSSGKQMTTAQVKAEMQKRAEAIRERIGAPETNAISLKDKLFTLPDGQVIQKELKVVIVDFISANKYYDRAFDPKNPRPPVCFALSDRPTNMVPSENSPIPQSTDCDSCPQNEFGSGTGDGKACKNKRLLAVILPDDPDQKLYTIEVPPASLKPFDGYVGSVARIFGVEPVGVVTTITMHPESTYTKLIFEDPVENKEMAAHFNRMAEARDLLMTEPDVSQIEAELTKPAKGRARRKK